jgi:hypothetical protein
MMTAKRVSVILREMTEHMASQGSKPVEWRFEVLGAAEVSGRIGSKEGSGAVGVLFEAYSARDAHDVECELVKLGCVCENPRDDATRNFIWIERCKVRLDAAEGAETAPLRR